MFEMLALSMQNEYPGLTWKDARAILDRETTPNLSRLLSEKYLREWEKYDLYEGYLTVEQLKEQSGLSKTDLYQLENVHL